MSLPQVKKIIAQSNSFLISTHVNPDPDALCSALVVVEYLQKLGKKAVVVCDEAVPQRFDFIPGIKNVVSFEQIKNEKFDGVVIVDCGDFERIGRVKSLIFKNVPIINIDHHITNTKFGTANIIDAKASSTAEVLFHYFKEVKFSLSPTIAFNLYTGIMTDTGSFRYENTTAQTHQIVGELMKFSLHPDQIYRDVYEGLPLDDLRRFSQLISRFEVLHHGRVIVMNLSKKISNAFSDEFDLRDALFKFFRSIKGTDVFVIFSEAEKNKTRVNFRSSGKVDVAKLSQQFNGGGHRLASGCTVDLSLTKARTSVLSALNKVL